VSQKDYTNYQKKVISAYYEHRDELALTSLQSVVTDLFLADTDAKRSRLWDRAHKGCHPPGQKPPGLAQIIPAPSDRISGDSPCNDKKESR
jgi:hypothetical protein